MKKLSFLLLTLFVASAVFFTSCSTEDDPAPVGPSITSDFAGIDTTVTPGSKITVTVDVRQGDKKLTHVTLRENGNIIDGRELTMDGTDIAGQSEYEVTSNDIIDVVIEVPTTEGSYNYTIGAFDKDDLSTSIEFTVEVKEAGTAVTEIDGALLNSAGPAGTGGIDLNSGTGTGSSEAGSELKDEGIDAGEPDATNWKQMISAINGAELKSTTVTYASVSTKEAIEEAFNNGTAISGATSKLTGGEVFVVKNSGGEFFLIEIDDVVVTTTDNADQYVINIKQ